MGLLRHGDFLSADSHLSERGRQAKTRIVIPGHGGTGGRGRQEELVRRSERRRVSDPSSEKDPSRQADGDESGRISAYAMELGKRTQPEDNYELKVDCQAEELPSS